MTQNTNNVEPIFQNERVYRIDNVNVNVRTCFCGSRNLNDILLSVTNSKFKELQ